MHGTRSNALFLFLTVMMPVYLALNGLIYPNNF